MHDDQIFEVSDCYRVGIAQGDGVLQPAEFGNLWEQMGCPEVPEDAPVEEPAAPSPQSVPAETPAPTSTAALPAGWESTTSRSTGDTYYVNTLSGETQYEVPQAPATTDAGVTVATTPRRGDAGGTADSTNASAALDPTMLAIFTVRSPQPLI